MKSSIKLFTIFWLAVILFIPEIVQAKIQLPKIFNNSMVLQRDEPVMVWGWATKKEVITVYFNNQKVTTKADSKGSWKITLQPMKFGGPYEMQVKGEEGTLTLSDVLIGDVWICSGQSNMEMPIDGWGTVNNAKEEIKNASHANIRLFTVVKDKSFSPRNDLKAGVWKTCSPKTISSFSAVAYFFGRKINNELGVPVGLISANWGGTNIQAWTSWDIMQNDDKFEDIKIRKISKMSEKWESHRAKYEEALEHDPGLKENWYDPNTQFDSWNEIGMPQSYEQSELGNIDGIVWFRKDFILDGIPEGTEIKLNLGPVDDADKTYINGHQVGSTDIYNKPRIYEIEPGLLKTGKNTVVVRVLDTGGGGGFSRATKDFSISVGDKTMNLAGEWLYKPSVTTDIFDTKDTSPNAFPSQLYNAMIAPLTDFRIKGAIWYQGESNASEAYGYRTMFPAMIQDWREKWRYEFPFLWAQLANFMVPDQEPEESEWAELREAQHMALSLPKTGEAVLIDIGEAGDIHPKNKQDVGLRLALSALKVAYNKDVVFSGPVFTSMTIEGNKAILTFDRVGSGLMAKDKYGYLRGFAIAGKDKKFTWAKAEIEGRRVIVSSEKVPNPQAVRYAWANNPDEANLYNEEGLPASPFRTDSLKGITER